MDGGKSNNVANECLKLSIIDKIALYYKSHPSLRFVNSIPVLGSSIHEYLTARSEQIEQKIRSQCREISTLNLLRTLWGLDKRSKIYIVCPELEEMRQFPEPREFLYLGKYGDIDSLVVILYSLSKLYPVAEIRFFTSGEFENLPGNPLSNNLILIGGPDYNTVTRRFMRYVPFKFIEEGDETVLYNSIKRETYRPEFKEENGIIDEAVDYGFFVKIPNPFNEKKKLIMINGVHTIGVFGAAKAFSFYDLDERDVVRDNAKTVIDAIGPDPYFAAVFRVNYINRTIPVPTVDKSNLYRYYVKEKKFQQINRNN